MSKKTKKNKTPISVSEQDILSAIENISRKLSYKFKFGYHELEDMRQQISIFAIEGLKKYDYERPLENFLWTHVRNRLYNFKRDNYQRPDKPCTTCEFLDSCSAHEEKNCTQFCNKHDCALYASWYNRNNAKKNLMHLNTIEDLKDYASKKNNKDPDVQDLFKILDEELKGGPRKTYLKIRCGSHVYKKETDILIKNIKQVLKNE